MDFQWYEPEKVSMFLWVIQLDASSSLPQSREKFSNQVYFCQVVETPRNAVVEHCYACTEV